MNPSSFLQMSKIWSRILVLSVVCFHMCFQSNVHCLKKKRISLEKKRIWRAIIKVKIISIRSIVVWKKIRKRETDFCKRLFQKKLPGKSDSTKFTYHVPIISPKKTQFTLFYPHVPVMKYLHGDANTCCFSSLASVMFSYAEYRK